MKNLSLNKSVCLIAVLLVLSCLIVFPAFAQTLTGTLGGDVWNSTNYDSNSVSGGPVYFGLQCLDLEKTVGFYSLISFTNRQLNTFDAGAPSGAQTDVIIRLSDESTEKHDGEILGYGTIGYQRIFNTAYPPVEQLGGYVFLTTSMFSPRNYTGLQYLYLEYNHTAVYNMTAQEMGSSLPPSGKMYFYGGAAVGGLYTIDKLDSIHNEYTATKPMGLGITGIVSKLSGGSLYASRAFIINATSSTTISSQNLITTSDFIYNVPADTIRISILSSLGNWYNSSDLFSIGGITPTPTPTPTVTPPQTGSFTANFYIKDNANNTAIPSAFIEVHSHDNFDSIYAGYTDSNGLHSFSGVPFPTYAPGYSGMEARVFEAGYQYQAYSFTPTSDITHTIYLVSNTGSNPVIPATVNITVHSIDSSNGNANLANAYVEVYPNAPGPNGIIDWTVKFTGFTNTSGLITFQNVPASSYNEIKTTKTGYSIDDYSLGVFPLGDFSHNAYLTTFGVTPIPTPLPVTGNYTLAISPTAVQNGGTSAATISSSIDPTLASIQQVWYTFGDPISDPVHAFDFFESGSSSKALQYIKTNGTWYGWDYSTSSFSNNKGASIPNPTNLIFNGPAGTKAVYCDITLTNGIQYELKGTVVVGAGATQITTHIQARDGLGNGIIYNPEIDVLNKNTLVWTNATYPNGAADITSPSGTYFDVYGIKAGYAQAQLSNIKASASTTYSLLFFSGVTPSAGNQSLSFWVTNVKGVAIPGASVRLTESGTTTNFTGTTGQAGTAQFVLKTSTLYTYNVISAGYQSASGSFTTSTLSSDVWVVQMVVGVNPTATIPPSYTVTPTIIPTNPAGNYTGFWGPIANAGQAMGATPDLIPLLMAALLIFIGFCVGGWSGAAYSSGSSFNPMVSMVGGVFGFVLSCLFGFLPIVWIISIIILGVFVFTFLSRG